MLESQTKTSDTTMQGITLDRSLSGALALNSGPSLSLEQERDSLKEKYEHLKILLNHFKHENQSQQRTKDGLENVTRLLQEARQENASLQKRNRSQETVIRTLQSRLVTNGLSGGIGIEETDLFTPGTSNQVFENLIKEVTRLRTLLHSASIEPEEVDRLRQVRQGVFDWCVRSTNDCSAMFPCWSMEPHEYQLFFLLILLAISLFH